MTFRGIASYWYLPIISGLVWFGMLLAMLLWWIVDSHRRIFPSMEDHQTIAYISDIGAFTLKPLFITGSAITAVFLDLSFLAERWLRHRGRLVPNVSRGEKILTVFSIVFAVIGTAGLILLTILDTYHHPSLHDVFLLLFIGGYLISAIFICWEYQRLGMKHREHRVLRISFWVKLVFIIVELILAATYAGLLFTSHSNAAAIIEWVVAFVFTFYVLSFVFDLYPAVHTRGHNARFDKAREMEHARSRPSDSPLPLQNGLAAANF